MSGHAFTYDKTQRRGRDVHAVNVETVGAGAVYVAQDVADSKGVHVAFRGLVNSTVTLLYCNDLARARDWSFAAKRHPQGPVAMAGAFPATRALTYEQGSPDWLALRR